MRLQVECVDQQKQGVRLGLPRSMGVLGFFIDGVLLLSLWPWGYLCLWELIHYMGRFDKK